MGYLESQDPQFAGPNPAPQSRFLRHGSWPPEKDAWGKSGGRLMTTSLSTLTLEVYYRYLPLFKTDESDRGIAR